MVSMIGMVFQLTRKDGILLLKRPKDHVDHADHVTKVNELIVTRGHDARITYHPTIKNDSRRDSGAGLAF